MSAGNTCEACGLVGGGVTDWPTLRRVLCGPCREAAGDTNNAPGGSVFDGAPMDPAAVEAEPLAAVPGFPFMIPGNAAVVVGPTGGGRSSLAQAGLYDAARSGLRCAYLGSEVTEPEFNARAADLADRRCDPVDDALRGELARVRYLNLAGTVAHAWATPDEWTREMPGRFDVVVIDPLSAVAAALDLDFDKSNAEFVSFYNRLIQPLATAGVAVLMLDNVGHALEARTRAKGASAKSDVADLTFHCKLKSNPVGLIITAGKVRTVRAGFRRGDAWIFDRETQRFERHDGGQAHAAEPTFRPTIYMERVSRAVETEPGLTRRALRSAVTGKHEPKMLALEILVAEGFVEQRHDGQYPTHQSTRPFRESEDTGPRGPHAVPDWSPGTSVDTGPPVPTHKDRGPGTTPDLNADVVPVATDEQEALIARLEVA